MEKTLVISSNSSWSIYNFRINLIRSLRERGYRVVIVAPYDKYSNFLKEEFEYYNIFINPNGINPLEDLKTIWQYYKIYKEIKPKIALHFTIKPNIYGNLVCKLLKIKTINNISGLGSVFIRESLLTAIVKRMYRLALYNSDRVFFQNTEDLKLFITNRLVRKENCDVLPGSGVDIEKFKPIKLEKRDNTFRFLLIARMLWDKGIGEYIEAAKIIKQKYKNVEFLLLGPADVNNPTSISEEKIKEWVNRGIVKYLGVTDDVRYEIARADCIVLPSYREGTSRVLLESAAMAKPIITTNVAGCKEVVVDGLNGYLCKVKDVKDLASKMEKMINLSKEKRELMGRAGREKIVKEFNEKIVLEKYIKVIEEILN